jgi:hypothetical protein
MPCRHEHDGFSKTYQFGKRRSVFLPQASGERCPIKSLKARLTVAGIEAGWLFRSVTKGGVVSDDQLRAQSVASIVKRAARAMGREPEEFSGHSNVGEDGHPVISRDRVDAITGTTNRQALIVGRRSGGAIVLVLQSAQDDSLLTYTFDTVSSSAKRQLSGQRAGMFLAGLDGLEAESLMDLAQQDGSGDQPPTALCVRVSEFLASQGRDHVVGVGFISKGGLRPAAGGVTDSGAPPMFSRNAKVPFGTPISPACSPSGDERLGSVFVGLSDPAQCVRSPSGSCLAASGGDLSRWP